MPEKEDAPRQGRKPGSPKTGGRKKGTPNKPKPMVFESEAIAKIYGLVIDLRKEVVDLRLEVAALQNAAPNRGESISDTLNDLIERMRRGAASVDRAKILMDKDLFR